MTPCPMFAVDLDPAAIGGWGAVAGIGLWFLKSVLGPAIERHAAAAERRADSDIKRNEATIDTMREIRDGTIGTGATVARIDARLEAHTARDAAAQDQILAEIRVLADAKKPA